jgi:hypothetical protein
VFNSNADERFIGVTFKGDSNMENMRVIRFMLVVLTALIMSVVLSARSYAEQTIEQIVVTAQKKSESLQFAPSRSSTDCR